MIIDTLKRNAAAAADGPIQSNVTVDSRTKISRIQLCRQALAVLLNILTFPGSYSASKARQAMIANDIHDVIEQNKEWIAAEKDIVATSNAILGQLMQEWY